MREVTSLLLAAAGLYGLIADHNWMLAGVCFSWSIGINNMGRIEKLEEECRREHGSEHGSDG